jgi:hypothetical protein
VAREGVEVACEQLVIELTWLCLAPHHKASKNPAVQHLNYQLQARKPWFADSRNKKSEEGGSPKRLEEVEKGVLAQRNLTRNGKRREATAANLAKQTSAEEK